MKRYYTILLITLLLPLYATAAPTAASVVEKAVEKIRKSPSLSANIRMESGSNAANGTFLLAGDRFVITSDLGSTWYDGKTLWSYSPDTNEVTITEPTEAELSEINPFQFVKAARTAYNARMLKTTAQNHTIELTPKSKGADISKAVVTVDAATYFIKSIILTVNNNKINIRLSGMRVGKQLSDNEFRFNKKYQPNAEINDLR